MRKLLSAVVLVSLVTVAAPVVSQSAHHEVSLVATEGPDCPITEQRLYCFLVESDNLGDIRRGDTVTLTLENQGQAPHNAYIAAAADADEDRAGTPGSAAFANTTTVGSGQSTDVTFEVPTDVDGLYIWCEVGDHEQMGMWIQVEVAPASQPDAGDHAGNGTGGGGTGDEDREEGIPGPGVAALGAALAAAALVAGRRRE